MPFLRAAYFLLALATAGPATATPEDEAAAAATNNEAEVRAAAALLNRPARQPATAAARAVDHITRTSVTEL